MIQGKVDFIEPVLQEADKTTSIRVYINNFDHKLMANSLVKAVINVGLKSGLWIPNSSIVSLGQNKIVWLKSGSVFRVRLVTAESLGDSSLIISGITSSDTIATKAQYLSDSESFIQLPNHD